MTLPAHSVGSRRNLGLFDILDNDDPIHIEDIPIVGPITSYMSAIDDMNKIVNDEGQEVKGSHWWDDVSHFFDWGSSSPEK